ncbi:MAG: hypothetical protein ACYTGC_20665 [Planctomycetota bacterium]|jgi:hypothetical protein
MHQLPRIVSLATLAALACGCQSNNRSFDAGEPLTAFAESMGTLEEVQVPEGPSPSLQGSHDRSHWPTVHFEGAIYNVEHPPRYSLEGRWIEVGPRSRGEYPTADTAVLVDEVVPEDWIENTMDAVTAFGSFIITPIWVFVEPVWTVKRSPLEQYAREPMMADEDLTRWFEPEDGTHDTP